MIYFISPQKQNRNIQHQQSQTPTILSQIFDFLHAGFWPVHLIKNSFGKTSIKVNIIAFLSKWNFMKEK